MKVKLTVPPQFVLSILAPSYLITHQWGEKLVHGIIAAGTLSEEIFRGDRLPTLPFPHSIDPDPSPPNQ
ncbi:MAG: hypothetical protein HC799_10590 [Limnothrix sp. RL_2_0]|nr:hypothetical protein [Limnothrix sp. RL_2_0]